MFRSNEAQGPPIARRDVLIAVLFTVAGVVLVGWAQDDGSGAGDPAVAMPVMGLLFALVTVPVLWRRRTPLLALGGTLAGLALHVALYRGMTRCGILLPLVFVEAYAVAAGFTLRVALAGLGLALVAQVVGMVDDFSAGIGGLGVAVPITLAVWAIGRVVRSRQGLVSSLQDRTAELRETRDERARLEVASDRLRLSSDLDALLRRRLAELTRMADAGAGEDARVALQAIERESRTTLEEMRAVVGVLRGDDQGAARAPQPTLTGLDALLVHAAGEDGRLEVVGSPRALPPGLELSAYRVVEHLLGALDASSSTRVVVDFSGDALELTVSGQPRRKADAPIERARERVALHQGTLRVAIRDGRSDAVAAFPALAAV